MTEFLSAHWLDIFTTLLGLLYIGSNTVPT